MRRGSTFGRGAARMMRMSARKVRLLVNLPDGFYRVRALRPFFRELTRFATVRRRSHNTAGEIAGDLAWADVVLMWSWPKLLPGLLDRAPRLRMAAHLDISQQAAKVALERGLPVSVARGAFSPAVAEMAMALLLCVLRRVSDYHAAMRRGDERWVRSFPDDIDPLERRLAGLPVGLIGFGRIGRHLSGLLRPFDCPVRAYDPFVDAAVMQQHGVRKASLAEVISRSDAVVLCAPCNPGTRHLLGGRQIASLRRNAVLVNVARAALVDTDALIGRLRRGDLYAAIDVFDQEPLPADHPLRTLPNAYLTPHRAGGVISSVCAILRSLIDDIRAFLAGRPISSPLTAAMLPALDA